MWLLFLLTLLDGIRNAHSFVLQYRLDVAGVPVNVYDLLLTLGLLLSPLVRRRTLPNERIHPALMWSMLLFVPALLGGTIAGAVNGATPRWILTELRNMADIPIAVWIGYVYLTSLKSAWRYGFVMVIT